MRDTTDTTSDDLRQRRTQLLDELTENPFWIRGSVVETTQKGRTPTEQRRPHRFISRKVEGRSRSVYLRKECVEVAKRASARRDDVERLIDEIAEINIELIKRGEAR